MVFVLAFHLWDPGSNPVRAQRGLGFQLILDNSLGFSSHTLDRNFLLSMVFLDSVMIEFPFLGVIGFTTRFNKWNECKGVKCSTPYKEPAAHRLNRFQRSHPIYLIKICKTISLAVYPVHCNQFMGVLTKYYLRCR